MLNATSGKRIGAPNYNAEDVDRLLDIVKEVEQIDRNDCAKVEPHFAEYTLVEKIPPLCVRQL